MGNSAGAPLLFPKTVLESISERGYMTLDFLKRMIRVSRSTVVRELLGNPSSK
jgi:hypothetical protein